MVKRVVVFVDYQNVYRRARDAFHNHQADPHWMGQVIPSALGNHITAGVADPERALRQVRMYRGMPNPDLDPRGYSAARRQVSSSTREQSVRVITRPFRYPRVYPVSRPQEKGIDVQIALDFVMMAVRGDYDIGVLIPNPPKG